MNFRCVDGEAEIAKLMIGIERKRNILHRFILDMILVTHKEKGATSNPVIPIGQSINPVANAHRSSSLDAGETCGNLGGNHACSDRNSNYEHQQQGYCNDDAWKDKGAQQNRFYANDWFRDDQIGL